MKKLVWIFICALGVSAVGCRAKSPKMQGPVQTYEQAEQEGVEQAEIPPQQLDVLFVVDNSLSMDRHQKRVRENIASFVHGFKKNALIDFHVGVMSVYDKKSFEELKKDNINNALGILHTLKDPAKNNESIPGPRFVTRDTPRMEEVLGATINMGTSPGPQFEEAFSPVVALLDKQTGAAENQGFYRPNAHLAVILVTDAEDATQEITPDLFNQFLVGKKGGDKSKVSVFGVVIPSTQQVTKSSSTCPRDYGNQSPARIESVVGLTGGRILDLCSDDFGRKLARVGILIAESVGTRPIRLRGVPDENKPLRVMFNSKDLKPSEFFYESKTKTLTIKGDVELSKEDGRTPKIIYTPVNLTNLGTSKLQLKN